ncbi:MAG: efflux RND transporter permease subunit [Fidelibacterota bacterium]
MFHVLKWVLKHPVSVLLIVVIFTFVGLLSLIHIPIEIKPDPSGQGIQIVARWEKQPPETVQRLITRPLEDVAMRIPDVSAVESSTGIGTAVIELNFPKNTDLKYAYIDLRERLASIRDQLPQNTDLQVEPLFKNEEAEQAFLSSFSDLELVGSQPLDELRRLAKEQVLPRLNGVDGISRLELFGGSDGYVRILLDRDKMDALHVEPEQVTGQLQEWLINTGLGVVKASRSEFLLVWDSRPESIRNLNAIPIRNGVSLGDIAEVSFAYEPPQRLSRHNFLPLVTIKVFKARGINTLVFSHALKTKINEIQTGLPPGVRLRIAADNSRELRNELNSLGVRSAVILLVVFCILFILFRRWVHSFIILLVVLFSLIGSAIFLYFTGYTINVVTLAGIALVFGMLVDNAIVVVENIQRIHSAGKSPFYSGMRGTLEVALPLLASTGTTVFVFFALLLLKDRLGLYYRPMAFVLGFSLIMSLVIALILIPAVFIRWPRLMKPETTSPWTGKILYRYGLLLSELIHHSKITLVIFISVFAATSFLFWKNIDKGGFFPGKNDEKLSVYVDAPKGVTLNVLDEITHNFERIIKNQQIPCETRTLVDEPGGYGYITVTFPDTILHSMTPYVLKEYLISAAVNYAGVGIGISGFGMPYWNGGYQVRTLYNTTLQITGPDYYKLQEIGENILTLAKLDPRVDEGVISPSARSIYQSDLKEISFTGNTEKIWRHRLSLSKVKTAARHLFSTAQWQGAIRINNRQYPMKIEYRDQYPELDSLKNGYLRIPPDRRLPVADYFTVTNATIQPWIDKQNQQYKFTVAWQYRGPERMRSRHEKSIVQALRLPPGYALVKQSWGFLTRKEESDLRQLLLIVGIGTFMILAALYESFVQPFIIFITVPFALVGVFLFYVLFERDFNVNGYIGLIILLGIVLNNGIVLVERMNQLIQGGLSTMEAAVEGGKERIRPIMITTLTTVGGLIPLLFLSSGNTALAKILNELSFITIGGLVSSTVLTMTLIPVLYCIFKDRKHGV